MTKDEMHALQPGDIIQQKGLRIGYIVAANYGTRITVVRTEDVTNPSEWDVIYQRRLTSGSTLTGGRSPVEDDADKPSSTATPADR